MAAQIARASKERVASVGAPASMPAGGTIATGVPTTLPAARTHSVRAGENLVAIARNYSCDFKELAQANRITGPAYAVRTGAVLKLEGCGR
jgi:LysM repeat protein